MRSQGPNAALPVGVAPLLVALVAVLAVAAGVAKPAAAANIQNHAVGQEEQPLNTPGGPGGFLAVHTIAAPQVLVVTGQAWVVYELTVTNFQTRPIVLTSLSAQAGQRASQEWSGKALAAMVDLPPRYGDEKDALLVAPLNTRILLVWLAVGAAKDLPAEVTETIDYRFAPDGGAGDSTATMSVTTAPRPIDLNKPPVIGPPLRGNLWLAANGPSNTSGHARAFFLAHGRIYFPERFAIDFVQLGANGLTYSGDPKKNQSYYCYGTPALAVADGVVAAVKDGIPDNTPGSVPESVTLSNIGGNYVLLNLRHGRYAFYAHLIPGSIRVHVGQRVRRGATLGQVGNSGNSTEPHLHFHIVSGPSALNAQGLAYEYNKFTLVHGQVEERDDKFKFVANKRKPEKVSESLMLENEVVDFPSR